MTRALSPYSVINGKLRKQPKNTASRPKLASPLQDKPRDRGLMKSFKSPLRSALQQKGPVKHSCPMPGLGQGTTTGGPNRKPGKTKLKLAPAQAGAPSVYAAATPKRKAAPQTARPAKAAKEPVPRAPRRPATSRKAVKSPPAKPAQTKPSVPATGAQTSRRPDHGRKPLSPALPLTRRVRERQPSPAPAERRVKATPTLSKTIT